MSSTAYMPDVHHSDPVLLHVGVDIQLLSVAYMGMADVHGPHNDTHTLVGRVCGRSGCRRPELDGVGDMDTDGQDKGRSASRRQTGGEAHPKLKGHGREKKDHTQPTK